MKVLQLILDPSHTELAFASKVEDPLYLLITNFLARRIVRALAAAL